MVCNGGTGVPLVEVPLKRARVIASSRTRVGAWWQAMPIGDGAEYGVDELSAVAPGQRARREVDRNARAHHEPLGPVETVRTVGA